MIIYERCYFLSAFLGSLRLFFFLFLVQKLVGFFFLFPHVFEGFMTRRFSFSGRGNFWA
jgi:hypothetical protein